MSLARLVLFSAAIAASACGSSTPSIATDAGTSAPDAADPCAAPGACAADAGRDANLEGGAVDRDAGSTTTDGGDTAACTGSGGTLGTASCCAGVSDFPNTCAVGACACAPSASHEVKVCACARNACFDGTRCVTR